MQQTVCCQENQFTTCYLLIYAPAWPRRSDARGEVFAMFVLKTRAPCDSFVTRFISPGDSFRRPGIFLSPKNSLPPFASIESRFPFYPSPISFVAITTRDCIGKIRKSRRGFAIDRGHKIYFRPRAPLATSLNKTIMKVEFDRCELIGDS